MDCDFNGIPDSCELEDPNLDCNGNGQIDSCDISTGLAEDCDFNGVPDSCEFADPTVDCDGNGEIDSCELANGTANDCNGNGITDACDIANAGRFEDSGQILAGMSFEFVALGDLDGDGDLDAFVTRWGPKERVFLMMETGCIPIVVKSWE